jgi:hypothetical protein
MKYDWDKGTREQKLNAVENELQLATHNGTTKDDMINIIRFLKTERDAAVEDLEVVATCELCKHFLVSEYEYPCSVCCHCEMESTDSYWTWRGPQQEADGE